MGTTGEGRGTNRDVSAVSIFAWRMGSRAVYRSYRVTGLDSRAEHGYVISDGNEDDSLGSLRYPGGVRSINVAAPSPWVQLPSQWRPDSVLASGTLVT